jgi:hypothetical protein
MNHPHVNPARPELIDEFFQVHLPAKLAALESYPRHSQALSNSNTEPVAKAQISTALSHACMVSGRMLLEFLGVRYDVNKKELANRRKGKKPNEEFDVYVDDLGGTLVDVNQFTPSETQDLKAFLHAANRTTHLTWDDRDWDGYQNINAAVDIILRLMQDHLFAVAGRPKVEVRPPS